MPTTKVISKQVGSSQSRRFLATVLMDHSLPDMTMAEKEIPLNRSHSMKQQATEETERERL